MIVVIIVLIVLAVLVLGSVGLGAWASYDMEKPTQNEIMEDPCAVCKAEEAWYQSLSGWDKTLYSAWYLTRGGVCALKGC
jgi:hypothetical protein